MLNNAKRIVIKIGSSLIADEANLLREEWMYSLAQDIAELKKQGKQVIIVTSGAVALGRHILGYGRRALELEEKQASAACGQYMVVQAWAEAFQKLGDLSVSQTLRVAQILLTADDSIERRRYLNARNTMETLLAAGIVPVINENDTVATAELRFGDNDRLAARVAQMAGADLLIVFSDVDGLYSANPSTNKDAKFIEEVTDITPEIERMAGGAASSVSSGGMITKIAAAKIATAAGCHMMIARGTENHPLKNLKKCTRFIAKESPLSARKHWIAGSLHSAGSITVDEGAAKALKGSKSLLPAGVVAVEGRFDRGDAVLIKDKTGTVLGKGLIAYAHEDASRIVGKQSQEIEAILGFKGRDVLIHRDDLVLE